MRSPIVLVAVVLCTQLLAQQKPAVTPADYGKWESLGQGEISPDGKWLAYQVQRANGNHELRLAGLAGGKTHVAAFGASPAFSEDSQWLAYSVGVSEKEEEKLKKAKKPARKKLGLVRLATGETSVFENVSAFSFSRQGAYLAMHHYPPEKKEEPAPEDDPSAASREPIGSTLVARNLAAGADNTFGSVSSYAWQDPGAAIAMTINAEGKAGNGIQVFDPATGALRVLDSASAIYTGLAWRKDANDLAVLRSKSDQEREEDTHLVLAWKNLAGKRVYDPTSDSSFPAGKRTVRFRAPSWSDDGGSILVGVAEWPKKPPAVKKKPEAKTDGAKEKESEEEEEPANVQVWHARDARVMSEQKLGAARDRQRHTVAVWHIDSARLVPLSSDWREQVHPAKTKRHAVLVDPVPYEQESIFGRRSADLYRLDTVTGNRVKIRSRVEYHSADRPFGRHLLYLFEDNYWVCDLETGAEINLTKNLKTSFVNREFDHPVKQKPPAGLAGWTKGARSVIVYDEYDLWELAPDGSKAVRLTNGAGEQVRHRYVRLDPKEEFIDPDKPLYLTLQGRWTKKAGIARLSLAKPGTAERLLWLDKLVGRLAKAKSADVYAYTAEDFDDSADYFAGGPDLKNARQATETNPFQNQYAWGRSELVEYKNSHGERLQGALFYPAHFERGRQYPMIVNIYEIMTGSLHRYSAPSERAPYNAAAWTSRGYFLYQPDIVFRPRRPGLSALDCVTAGVRKALETGMIDPRRIGLIGHSWGAYETTFISTQTDLFAAAVAGAPLTNLVSSFGEIYWNTGVPETGHVETGQERMEVPLWEDPQAYVRNSAVFFADQLKTPLLLAHGDKDGACDWHQSIEMYNLARRAGRQVVMLVYPGENHSLRVKANQIDYHRRILDWFGHYLKADPAPKWISEGVSFLEREKELKQLKKSKSGSAPPAEEK